METVKWTDDNIMDENNEVLNKSFIHCIMSAKKEYVFKGWYCGE